MNYKNVKLPSNRKFGLFFALLFTLVASYLMNNNNLLAYILYFVSIIFISISLIKADILQPLNRAWMSLGFFLGLVIGPITLGIVFFGLITPFAFFLKLINRDELGLRTSQKSSFWKDRVENFQDTISFRNQF